MNNKSDQTLRQQAEKLLRNKKKQPEVAGKDMESLLHELQVHQVELEMQNEELRKTQYVLESSREKYRDLYEHAPVGYLLVNDQGVMVKTNLTFCAMLGEQRFKVIGKPFSQWICKEYQDHYYLFRQRCLVSETISNIDLQLCSLDGGKFFVRIQGICGEISGSKSGLRLTINVISDERELQSLKQELQEIARHLDCALDAADGGFWQLNLTNNTMRLDGRAARITGQGKDPQEKDFSFLLNTIHGDHREQVKAAILAHLTAEAGRFEEEFQVSRPDGSLVWLSVRGRVTTRNGEGEATIMKGILLNINRRKKLEQELNSSRSQLYRIVDHLPACVSYIDSDQRFQYNNKYYEKLFALSAEACKGKQLREVIGERGYQNCLHQVEAVLDGQEVHFENVVFTPDNVKRLLQVSYIPDFDQKNQVRGFFVLAFDITDSDQMQKLKEANIALKVLIDQQQSSREDMEQQILNKLTKLVFPYLDLLQGQLDATKKEEYLTLIRIHLESVADSFVQKLSNPLLKLSPREILIADLVKSGKTTQDMAKLLNLSVRTVEAYRMQLRKKLGLNTKKENLRKYLLHSFGEE